VAQNAYFFSHKDFPFSTITILTFLFPSSQQKFDALVANLFWIFTYPFVTSGILQMESSAPALGLVRTPSHARDRRWADILLRSVTMFSL